MRYLSRNKTPTPYRVESLAPKRRDIRQLNPDDLSGEKIKQGIEDGFLSLVSNTDKTRSDMWKHFSLVGIVPVDDDADPNNFSNKLMTGWSACNYCYLGIRYLSKADKDGKRSNFGGKTIKYHLNICVKSPVYHNQQKGNNDNTDNLTQTTVSRFAWNKAAKLSAEEKYELKLRELKFVVMGRHPFLSVEEQGLLELCQFCTHLGATHKSFDLNASWYGRKTIRETCLDEFAKVQVKLKVLVKASMGKRELACTTDLWTDDYNGRSYLDFTAFWITEGYELRHTALRCQVFDSQQTADNINSVLMDIFREYELVQGDTPMTTDSGPNVVAALREELRLPCMAHKLSNVESKAWADTKKQSKEFSDFDESLRDVVGYVHRTKSLQHRMPVTIKSFSATRPWRSYYQVPYSVLASYEPLRKVLIERKEEARIMTLSVTVLKEVSSFFQYFAKLFDKLEAANHPTLHMVLPCYYKIQKHSVPQIEDCVILMTLKENVHKHMVGKYWNAITSIHVCATFLDPSFRSFAFVGELDQRQTFVQQAKDAILQLVPDAQDEPTEVAKKPRMEVLDEDEEDIFSDMKDVEEQMEVENNITPSDAAKNEIQLYISGQFTSVKRTNPLRFWKANESSFPLLADLARKILVIPATSGESERHFNTSGDVVDSKRTLLDPEAVESLVVLKEASLNGLW